MTPRKVAIVTGGSRGIGSGIATALAADGFDLLLTFNTNEEAANAFAAQLRADHAELEVVLVGGDMSLPATRAAVFAALDASFPDRELGVMVHNAGQYVGITSENAAGLSKAYSIFGDGTLLDEHGAPELAHMKYYQALYGDAFIDLCERAAARMGNGGSLVGISSSGCSSAQRAAPMYSLPGSGKCVMEYAMRIFAKTIGAKNVNCNVVVPGFTLTGAWEKVAEARGMEMNKMIDGMVQRLVPMKRAIGPKEIGDVVAFLCSSKGRYVTGASLPVDGGFHLG